MTNIKASNITPFLMGLLFGLGLALATLYLRAPNAIVEGRRVTLETAYGGALADGKREIDEAATVLNALMAKIRSMPKTDPRFEKSKENFIRLGDLDPELANLVPQGLPTTVLVRADGENAKIMMDWRLCGLAQIYRPELLEPRRSAQKRIGCPYIAVWTPGAKDW